jgi:ferritin-like metal-binding protein YciE
MATNIDEQLNMYLMDVHAIERQALEQVTRARKIVGDPEIAAAFSEHVRETERHRLYVEDRLMVRGFDSGGTPLKDISAKLTGVGMALFARFQPDTPGKLVAHAFSYEHMELAAYDLLERLAERAGDGATVQAAQMIAKEEAEMAQRLAACFDRAVEASLRELDPDDIGEQLCTYLADAHAIEIQAAGLLSRAPKMAGAEVLSTAFEEHLEETRHHAELLETRLRAHEASPSAIKDAALRLGALNLGMFLKSQQDTPAKLAGFAYAFEHLEIAAYELLGRVARRADDPATIGAVDEILPQERAAAEKIRGLFGEALQASLEQAATI